MRIYTLYFIFQIAFCCAVYFYVVYPLPWGIPGGSDGKESACDAGDSGSIPGQEDPLEKEITTHSSILAWKIPWMEKPVKLQSTESQRVGHD